MVSRTRSARQKRSHARNRFDRDRSRTVRLDQGAIEKCGGLTSGAFERGTSGRGVRCFGVSILRIGSTEPVAEFFAPVVFARGASAVAWRTTVVPLALLLELAFAKSDNEALESNQRPEA